jgi:hypothetical protein
MIQDGAHTSKNVATGKSRHPRDPTLNRHSAATPMPAIAHDGPLASRANDTSGSGLPSPSAHTNNHDVPGKPGFPGAGYSQETSLTPLKCRGILVISQVGGVKRSSMATS